MSSLRKASLIFIGVTITLLSACGGGSSGGSNAQTVEKVPNEQEKNNWNKGNWNEIDWQ
jgi:hypothetical protein